MADMNRNTKSPVSHGRRPSWTAKIAAALALCLTVRVLLAQAPAAPAALVREETDAQGFKYQIPNETLRKNRALEGKERSSVRQILNGQVPLGDPATRQRFRAYFQSYLFPVMTTEEGLKTLGKDRQDLLRDLMTAKSPDAHREVVELTFASLKTIVPDSAYRPASRYNAMLIISSLNDVEPTAIGAAPTLPDPMRTALPFILQQFQKADNPDVVKLAAILGLGRHLEWDGYKQTPMPPAFKAEIIKALTGLAEAKEAPEGRGPEGHSWMRRRAIEALSTACLTKPDAGIAATLEGLLKDETEALNVRFTAAAELGKIALQAPAKIDPVPTAKELGYLALFACENELTRAENFRKTEAEREARLAGTYTGEEIGVAGPGGRPGMPGMGGDSGGLRPLRPANMPGSSGEGGYGDAGFTDPSLLDPKHFRLDYLRRRIRQQLYAVQLGLTGGEDHPPLKKNANPKNVSTMTTSAQADAKDSKGVFAIAKTVQEKEAVDNVYHTVRKLIEVVEAATPETEFVQFVKDMRKEMKPLEAITKRLPPPGAPAGATVATDDAPSLPAAGGKAGAGKGAVGKGPAAKGPTPVGPAKRPAANKKSAARPPLRPQQPVFGQPRFGR